VVLVTWTTQSFDLERVSFILSYAICVGIHKFSRNAENGLSYDKLLYTLDKTHPRILEIDEICNTLGGYKTNYRWHCQLQEALHMWGKDWLLLLQKEGPGVRVRALWPRGRDLFLVREIHDVGLAHHVLAGYPKIHIILQRQRNEQSEHLRSERYLFIFHSRQPRPV
jgi:hypothetical protein